ncbi:MAG: DUF2203 domain-containing protein [Vampirovibrionales bacterium]|nr:DUF2203 domain-containing protein [Vampirovibrionales bacterium]
MMTPENPSSDTDAQTADTRPEPPQEPAATRIFSLEEAGALVPELRRLFKDAHNDLRSLHDELILYKRLHQQNTHLASEQDENGENNEDERTSPVKPVSHELKSRIQAFEARLKSWLQKIASHGVLVKDFERGLIDFPYRSKSGQLFFLCWQEGDDGVFYFHAPTESYADRKPITLLPD